MSKSGANDLIESEAPTAAPTFGTASPNARTISAVNAALSGTDPQENMRTPSDWKRLEGLFFCSFSKTLEKVLASVFTYATINRAC